MSVFASLSLTFLCVSVSLCASVVAIPCTERLDVTLWRDARSAYALQATRPHPSYDSSCSIRDRIQSKSPLVSFPPQEVQTPVAPTATGAPQLGQLIDLPPPASALRVRMRVQYSLHSRWALFDPE